MLEQLCGQNYDSGVYHTNLSGPRIASDKVRSGSGPALARHTLSVTFYLPC